MKSPNIRSLFKQSDIKSSRHPVYSPSPMKLKRTPELKIFNHYSLDQDKANIIHDSHNSAFKVVSKPVVKEIESLSQVLIEEAEFNEPRQLHLKKDS